MPQNVMNASVQKLDKVYVCAKCGMAFLFRSDVEYHAESAGHGEVCEVPL
jgi:hypothetical protein